MESKIDSRRCENLSAFECFSLGEKSLQGGDFCEARIQFEAALSKAPKMAGALFYLGLAAFRAGELREAMRRFRDAVALDRRDHEALYYLGESCKKCGLGKEGLELIGEAHRLSPKTPAYAVPLARGLFEKGEYGRCIDLLQSVSPDESAEALNLLGACHEKLGNREAARSLLRRSPDKHPGQEELSGKVSDAHRDAADICLRDGEVKLAVFSSLNSFLGDILEYFRKRFKIRVFSGENVSEMFDLMQWCDVAWFEWCDQLLIEASRMPKVCPILCRIHRYEAYTSYPAQVSWDNIDHIITVSDTIREDLLRRFRIERPISVVYNGLDFSRYEFPPEKHYGSKVAYAGYLKPVKNPSLLIQCFHELKRYDPSMTFHIAGIHQDYAHELYFNDMLKRLDLSVECAGWVPDIRKWYVDKDFVISASVSESFQYSVAEGIAMGLLPLVHTWRGYEQFYPRQGAFRTPGECVDCVRRYRNGDMHAAARRIRRGLEERSDVAQQCASLESIVRGLLHEAKTDQKRLSG